MTTPVPPAAVDAATGLRRVGARFVLMIGSHARGESTGRSDIDVAAHFGGNGQDLLMPALRVVPEGVDLVVLDTAPLEIAGRAALEGVVLDEADPGARIDWVATTRKIYLDERFRTDRARTDFVAAFARVG